MHRIQSPLFFGCFLIFPPSLSTMESSCGCSDSMVSSDSSTERLQFSISLKTIVLGIHHVPFPSSKFQPLSRICLLFFFHSPVPLGTVLHFVQILQLLSIGRSVQQNRRYTKSDSLRHRLKMKSMLRKGGISLSPMIASVKILV